MKVSPSENRFPNHSLDRTKNRLERGESRRNRARDLFAILQFISHNVRKKSLESYRNIFQGWLENEDFFQPCGSAVLRDAFAFKFAWATSDRSAFSGFHVSNERSVTDIAQRVKLVSVEHKGDKRGRALSHGWPCNPIGNLRRVSLCTRRYHGTRPRASLSRVRTGTRTRASLSCARVWMRFQQREQRTVP